MNEKELEEYLDHEIQWLRYYTHRDSRMVMTVETDFYNDLKPMGYVKMMMSLEQRCAPCFIKSNHEILEGMDLKNLDVTSPPRRGNLTPLEVAYRIFPERRQEFVDRLHPGEINTKIHTITDTNSRRYFPPKD
jgi:hypothetical protein